MGVVLDVLLCGWVGVYIVVGVIFGCEVIGCVVVDYVM